MLPGQFKPFGIICFRVAPASRRSLANLGFLTQTNTQMQELLRKMEADALARLPLPVGRSATQELARYKGFLKLETNRLKMLHRAGAGGLEVCNARAAVLDLLLKYLWEAAWAELPLQAHQELPSLALVAIGGYGRSELNPYSDIDLMFLHHGQVSAGRPYPTLTKVLDGILYPLWDVGLKVGHSVRTIDEAVKVANSDMQSKTSLIESRLVMGSEALFSQFQKMLVARCVQGYESEYIGMRVADQKDRRLKFGNSACMQEPNIKSGCGGLRDFQNLVWMAYFKYRTRSLADLETHGLITGPELKQLRTAYDFLLRVRTEMHYHADRAMDVLSKNLQPAVAHNLGYRERYAQQNGSKGSCAKSTRIRAISFCSPAPLSNAWPCCRFRALSPDFPCGPFSRGNARPIPIRSMGSSSSMARSMRFQTGCFAISRGGSCGSSCTPNNAV